MLHSLSLCVFLPGVGQGIAGGLFWTCCMSSAELNTGKKSIISDDASTLALHSHVILITVVSNQETKNST